jgi:hypothetical protein
MWPVSQQIKDQQKLVQWWGENVTVRHGPGGVDRAKNADRRSLVSVTVAERESGIAQQKVSKWRGHLGGDLDAYRDLLRGPSYRKAARFIGLARERLGAGKPRSQQVER